MMNQSDIEKAAAETRWAEAQAMALLAREGWNRDSIVKAFLAADWSLLLSEVSENPREPKSLL